MTVAAIIERDGRFLLVEEHTAAGLRLNNPAGHLDPDESLIQACMRETLEETAFAFQPSALVGVYLSSTEPAARDGNASARGLTYLRFAFCGALGAFEPGRRLDRGIVRTLWMDIDEIRACQERHRSPILLRCVEDYLVGARFPLALLATDLAGCAHQAIPRADSAIGST